jgi:hypothetical protein
VFVNGRSVQRRQGRRITLVRLRRPKLSKFTVRLVATLSDGEVVAHTIGYNDCAHPLDRIRVLVRSTNPVSGS